MLALQHSAFESYKVAPRLGGAPSPVFAALIIPTHVPFNFTIVGFRITIPKIPIVAALSP
jgi:hypothetical protein